MDFNNLDYLYKFLETANIHFCFFLMNNVFNWEEFGEFRVPSESERATLDALRFNDDSGREMFAPMRPHLFLNRQIKTTTYFMFIVCRWRYNITQRHLKTGGFYFSMDMNDVLFKWLMRLEKCGTVVLTRDTINKSVIPENNMRVFASDVFDRLQRIFRLVVYKTNLINASQGEQFISTSDSRAVAGEVNLHPTFYTRHVYDNLSKQRQFMAKKRKEMTNEDMFEFNMELKISYIHKAIRVF